MAPESPSGLAYRVKLLEDNLKEFKKEIRAELAELSKDVRESDKDQNDRIDRIVMVLLAATFSIIVFFLGVSFALLTGTFG